MQNNISNNVAFKGAFLVNFNKTYPVTRKTFEESIVGGIKGQVFENFEGKNGDLLYVLRNSKDYGIAKFLKLNGLKFKYMPEIDSRLGLDNEKPDEAIEYIKKMKPKVIKNINELMDFIEKNRTKCMAVQDSNIGICAKVLDNLRLNLSGKKERNNKGVIKIIDGDGFMSLSPKDANGIRYTCIKANNKYDDVKYYAVDEKGNPIVRFQTPDELLRFKELFNKAIKHYLGKN